MNRLSWLFAPNSHQLLFAIRLCIAIALALFLAMWLELQRPYWSMLETVVMIQPIPGQAVVRAFARGTGTVIAAAVGLLIVALFQQSYVLSAAGLVAWVSFCSFSANLLRNNLSYGFAIGGIICAMVVVLSHITNQPPFTIAVARTQESLLATAVVASINVIFAPPTGLRNYFNSRLSLLRDIGTELKRLAAFFDRNRKADQEAEASQPDEEEDPHPALQALASQTLALEQTRRYVRYESPEFTGMNRTARRLDYDILSLISAASSLHIYLSARASQVDTRAVAALAEPAQWMIDEPENPEAAKAAFDKAYDRILALAREPADRGRSRSLADWVVISRTLGIVSRCRAVMVTHGLLIANREKPSRRIEHRTEFGQPMDVKHAARNSIRTLIAVSAAAVIWIHNHDQLPTGILTILTSALTTILSTLPSPTAAASGFFKGLAAAALGGFILNIFVLPMANSYAMLMLSVLPYVFVAGLALALPNPALAGPGRISVLLLALLLHIQNGTLPGSSIGMLPGFTTYFQFVIGITGAVTLTTLSFHLIFPLSPRQRLREQMAGVFNELARGARHTRERFETRMYDRLNTLALSEIEAPFRFSARQAVQASINIGLEARSLVVVSRRIALPEDIKNAIADELNALRRLTASRQLASAERVEKQARSLHELAERMLAYAVDLEHEAERRLGIRGAICAELTASALIDYIQAFEHNTLKLERITASEATTG